MAWFKKKKNEEEDLSVVDDYKEPFTWRNFWDEQIVGRIKKINAFLKDKGVLYFLMSPFQFKSRLILKLVLIFSGVLIGIVPRSISMINEAKARNAAAEMATTKAVTVGDISIYPLASSQSDNQHVLAFDIQGDSADGVPGVTSAYDVKLVASRGVADAGNVKYRYKIVPMDNNNRLLLVYVDNRKQNDTTGIFNLKVKAKNSKVKNPTALEIVLSEGQNTNDLFRDGKISMYALSTPLGERVTGTDSKEKPIKTAEAELKQARETFKENEATWKSQGLKLSFTSDDVDKYVRENTVLPSIEDNSTTDGIEKLDPTVPMTPTLSLTITDKDKKTYSSTTAEVVENDRDDDKSKFSTPNITRDETLPAALKLIQSIQTAQQKLNQARLDKYTQLYRLATVLNADVKISDMSSVKTVEE